MPDESKAKKKSLRSTISVALPALLGSGLAILSGASTLNTKILPALDQSKVESSVVLSNKALPPKLVLKPVGTGFMIAPQHESHSSHSSHSSHASHSSHTS